MKRLLIAAIVLLVPLAVSAADSDFEYVPPGVAFNMRTTAPASGIPTGYEWQKQATGGAWEICGTGTHPAALTIGSILTAKQASRFAVRAYNAGWTCSATGCVPNPAVKSFGPLSDSSNWFVADIPAGKSGKPVKE